ncbi:MAG: amidohydrolase, partial [Candidatus Aminicenantes bacterium]
MKGRGRPADLVLTAGKVWTGDPGLPRAEAVAVRGGRILGVGSAAEIRDMVAGGTEVIDLVGALVLPGFTDAHTHFLAGGFALSRVDLCGAGGREEFAARIVAEARRLGPGRWVLGGGWDQRRFDPVELPCKEWIDAATSENPVCVDRVDLHTVLANSVALRIAGITKATPDPAGGEIVRDAATGEPTGILRDTAADLVLVKIPEPSFAEKLEAANCALRHAAGFGVTAVHEMGGPAGLEAFAEMERRGKLTAGVHIFVPIAEVGAVAGRRLRTPDGAERVTLAGLKGFVDGSLGSGTACFFEPYADDPSSSGLFHGQMFPEGIMEERIMEADRAGLQVAIHAIGDRANSVLLDIFERVMAVNGPRDRRWRVEHAQHVRPGDIVRYGRLGLTVSAQPVHLTDDGRWAEKKIGPERARTTYALRSLRDAGARMIFGSDWNVAPISPVLGIHAAVTRRTTDGKNPGGWVPEEKVSVEDAVRAYTVNPAWAGFAEAERGTLEAGKRADIVVLDRDIFAIPAEEIADVEVRMTVF